MKPGNKTATGCKVLLMPCNGCEHCNQERAFQVKEEKMVQEEADLDMELYGAEARSYYFHLMQLLKQTTVMKQLSEMQA